MSVITHGHEHEHRVALQPAPTTKLKKGTHDEASLLHYATPGKEVPKSVMQRVPASGEQVKVPTKGSKLNMQ